MCASTGAEAFAARAARELSAALISPRTLQCHQHEVFAKLRVCSRDVLEAALPGAGVYSCGST